MPARRAQCSWSSATFQSSYWDRSHSLQRHGLENTSHTLRLGMFSCGWSEWPLNSPCGSLGVSLQMTLHQLSCNVKAYALMDVYVVYLIIWVDNMAFCDQNKCYWSYQSMFVMIYHDIHVDSNFAIFLLQYVFIISIYIYTFTYTESNLVSEPTSLWLKHPVRLSGVFSVRITAALPRLGDQRFAEAGDRAMRQILQVLEMTCRELFLGKNMSYAFTLFKDTLLNFLEEILFFFFGGGDVLIVRSGEVLPFDDFFLTVGRELRPQGKTCLK